MKYVLQFAITVLFGLFLQIQTITAADKVTLAAVYIPLLIEKDKSGLFIDMTYEIGRRADIDFDISVVPARRSVRMFKSREVDGSFPMTPNEPDIYGPRTDAFYIRRNYAFVRKGNRLPVEMKDLEGLSVLVTRQYDYTKELLGNEQITIVRGSNDVANMKMLSRNRADAFIVEARSGLEAMRQADVDNVTYAADHPVSSMDAYYVFQPGKRGNRLATRVSTAIQSMIKDGTYKKIFGVEKP
jgi:ABC-type amino acid transport substrate-binding protein